MEHPSQTEVLRLTETTLKKEEEEEEEEAEETAAATISSRQRRSLMGRSTLLSLIVAVAPVQR